jgi:hypothetical protein
MIGSTIQQGYGENVVKHGFGIYNISENNYEYVDLVNKKPFLSFKINSFGDIENGKEKLTNYS